MSCCAIFAQAEPNVATPEAVYQIFPGTVRGFTSLSLYIPVTNIDVQGNTHSPGITLGGAVGAGLSYNATSLWAIGGGLNTLLAGSEGEKLFTSLENYLEVGLTPRVSRFEFPVSLGLGVHFLTYDENSETNFSMRGTIGSMFSLTRDYSLGVNVITSVIFQNYDSKKEPPPAEDSRTHISILPSIIFSTRF